MKLHKSDLALHEAQSVVANFNADIAVFISGQLADKNLAAVNRLIEAQLYLAAHELFKVRGTLELTLNTGRAEA